MRARSGFCVSHHTHPPFPRRRAVCTSDAQTVATVAREAPRGVTRCSLLRRRRRRCGGGGGHHSTAPCSPGGESARSATVHLKTRDWKRSGGREPS